MTYNDPACTYEYGWRAKDWVYHPPVYDDEGNLVRAGYTAYEVVDSGVVSKTVPVTGSDTFIKIQNNTAWYSRTSLTLINRAGAYNNTFPLAAYFNCYPMLKIADDYSRTRKITNTHLIDTYTADISAAPWNTAQSRLDSYTSYNIFHFWSEPTDDVLLSSYGDIVEKNGYYTDVTTNTYPVTQKIPNYIQNKSQDGGGGSGYSSYGTVNFNGGGAKTFDVNPIEIHTPIYNELTVAPSNKNQFEAKDELGVTVPIVTLGDKVKVTVNVKGPQSHYYGVKLSDLSKYVKQVKLKCDLCGKTYTASNAGGTTAFSGDAKNSAGYFTEYVHICEAKISLKDNKVWPITSWVYAENIADGIIGNVTAEEEVTQTETQKYNNPDKYYIVKQVSGVYTVGKMYDLQVRATDDPGWKDFVGNVAQGLNKLPIGEAGDNKVTAYKQGIKLGYRAFFDMKTLGVSTKEVQITPKIYYIDKAGNALDMSKIDIYYRTGPKTYEKLMDNGSLVSTAKDILINMSINTTKGEKYNTVFNEEKTITMKTPLYTAINYAKLNLIGGMKGIKLDNNQSLMTKYNGYYQYKIIAGYNDDGSKIEEDGKMHSRRWYGEVYLPASTIVTKGDATIADITKNIDVLKGGKVYRTGYLLVTFDSIETNLTDGTTKYLKYSNSYEPTGTNQVPPYILMNEKSESLPAAKSIIKLPNSNKQININDLGTDLQKTSAPIIIYDVSLRANNDFETGGTH